MRIVVVSGIFPPDIGGPATHAADLLAELTARGHRVRVLSLHDGDRIHDDGIVRRFPRSWPWPVRLIAVASWLVANRRSFDAVYATGLLPAAVVGARAAGRPVIVKVVGDPVWERGSREGLTRSGFESFQRTSAGGARLRAMRWLRDATLRAASEVIAPSTYLATVIDGWLGGPAGVEVIPNGVRATAALPDPRRDGSDLNLVFVGRLVAHKRVERLIGAVARTEGVHLEVVGDGPERAGLEEEATRLGLAHRVGFAGELAHHDVMARLAEADALVLASDYEGLPHVVIEALAAGTPVIASQVGGVEEVVTDGREGIVVRDPSIDGFAAAFERLRDDAELRARLREGARRSGESWRFEGTADRVEAILRGSIRRRPRVVFVGKTRVPEPGAGLGELRARYETLARHCRATVIGVGRPGIRWIGRTRTISFPDVRPAGIGALLFYPVAPAIAMALGVDARRTAIVCQSPYEGFGVGLLARSLPRSWRPRVVVEVHGDWRTATRSYGSGARRALAPVGDRAATWALRNADAVRVVGAFTEELVREIGFAGPVQSYVAFSDFAVFLERPPAALPSDDVVLYAGALERTKGIDVLIEAWPRGRALRADAQLVVCGDGALARAMRERARALGVGDAVRFPGSRSRAEIAEALDGAVLLAVPSRSEGLGRGVLEAFGRGRPVVASRVGGLPELVEDGENGLLVPREDPDSLARAIASLLADRERAVGMGARARALAELRDPAAEFDRGIARLTDWVSS